MEWVVYSKPPFKDAETLIDYLGRYTHRIAIGNHRILKMEDGQVFFSWRDYADGNKKKIMKLEASEFIRRFLLHVLPEKFVKLRYYGLCNPMFAFDSKSLTCNAMEQTQIFCLYGI
jgi:hypothetical protein